MQDLQVYDYNLKFILIGDRWVGKSCILTKYIRDKFYNNNTTTVGIEFGQKIINYRNKDINIQIWDTAGEERYRCISKIYYKGSSGALLVYDITNRKTFENVKNWYEEIKQYTANNLVIMLVGNKSDLQKNREVPIQEGANWAKQNNLGFIETSAKDGSNIEYTFKTLAETIVDFCEKQKIKKCLETDQGIQQQENENLIIKSNINKEKKCCNIM